MSEYHMKELLIKRRTIALSFLIFAILAFALNWSLILGTNIMKWDIWDAHLPMQIITSDAIRSGTIPVWNPLYNFGTPYYAMVGTPVWYPITLLLALIGYTPFTPGLEYSIHLALAGYGLFLLALSRYQDAESKVRFPDYCVCIAMGVLYEFSGVFLSNAEHIMIIISAAWFPWALLFVKRYALRNRIIDALSAGIFTGLILLGGYPEMLYDLFLVLVPWTLFWTMNKEGEAVNKLKSWLSALIKYLVVIVSTLAFSAITLIPFLRIMPLITRKGGQAPSEVPLSALLTAILPVTADMMNGYEISMGLYYTGFMTIVSVVMLFRQKNSKTTVFYFVCAMIALLLSLGSSTFLHTVLYRFFPMYSTFRFPTLWRAFFSIFIIMSVQEVWSSVISDAKYSGQFSSLLKKMVIIALGGALGVYIISRCISTDALRINADLLSGAMLLLGVILILYFFLASQAAKNSNTTSSAVFLVILIAVEALTVSYKAFPVTIGNWGMYDYFADDSVKIAIEEQVDLYANRNTDCNLAGNSRTFNGLFSQAIAYNKTFDEEGYVSIKLQKTEDYKQSYNRCIIGQNPEVYFTSNIVTEADIALSDWLQSTDIDPYQIHIADKPNWYNDEVPTTGNVDVNWFRFNSLSVTVTAPSAGILTVLQADYPGWEAYVDGKKTDIIEVDGCFIGVPVDQGQHEVVMKFRPADLYAGAVVTCLYVAGYIAVIVITYNSDKRRERANA